MRLIRLIRQKSYEHIVYQVRRNVITLVPIIFGLAVLFALPVALKWLLDRLFPLLLQGPEIYTIATLAGSLYYLFCTLFFYSYFVDFYLDLLVITNDRLIRINQQGLFSRTIFEVDLYQIEDATSEIKGAVGSLFGYGNIFIQPSGAEQKLIAEQVSSPDVLRRAIMDLAAEDKRHHTK